MGAVRGSKNNSPVLGIGTHEGGGQLPLWPRRLPGKWAHWVRASLLVDHTRIQKVCGKKSALCPNATSFCV